MEMPTDAFLADYPDAIREHAETLRSVVRRVVPDAIERVRPGWRLVGYDMPTPGTGCKQRYFAYIAPEPIHVHLGFEYGAWMDDPDRLLEGAHLKLRKVRYLTFEPGQRIPLDAALELTREAVRVARLTNRERTSIAFDHDWSPEGPQSRVPPGSRRHHDPGAGRVIEVGSRPGPPR